MSSLIFVARGHTTNVIDALLIIKIVITFIQVKKGEKEIYYFKQEKNIKIYI